MAFGIARQSARMQRDAVPRQTLLIGHRRIVIFVRAVVRVLLQDCEHAGRRLVTGLAGGDRRDADPNAIAIDRLQLAGKVDINQHLSGGRDPRCPDPLPRFEPIGHTHELGGRTCRRPLRQYRGRRAHRPDSIPSDAINRRIQLLLFDTHQNCLLRASASLRCEPDTVRP